MKMVTFVNGSFMVLTVFNSVISFTKGNIDAGLGWGCCAIWFFLYRLETTWDKF